MKCHVVVAGLVGLLLSGVATTTAGAATAQASPFKDYAHSKAEARAQADAMFDRLVVPAVVRQTGKNLRLQYVDIEPFQLDVPREYIVQGTQDPVIRWIRQHPPRGFAPDGASIHFSLGSIPYSYTQLRLKLLGHPGAHMQYLLIDGYQLQHGLVRIRVDAYVGWIPPRSQAEMVPSDLPEAWLSEAYDGSLDPDEHRNLSGPDARHLASLLNQLPTTSLLADLPCPNGLPRTDWAAFTITYGGHHATFRIYHWGCGDIRVTVDGQQQPPLADRSGLVYAAIDKLLPVDHWPGRT